ncbi:MAG: sugar transferase [Erysipelotrichaceae bacterium]|nr:sugar transferase [Erysipelotrichaceae bacterium]
MKKNTVYKHLDFLIIDEFSLLISFLLAYIHRVSSFGAFLNSAPYRSLLIMEMAIGVCVVFFSQSHKNILRRNYINELKAVLYHHLECYLILVFVLYLTKTSTVYSRVMVSLTYIMATLLSYVLRQIWKKFINNKSVSSTLSSNNKILIITDSKNLNGTIERVNKYNYDMYEIIGFCIMDKDMRGQTVDNYSIIVNKDDVMEYVCVNWVDEVYFAMDYGKIPQHMIKGLAVAGITTNVRLSKIVDLEGRQQSVKKLFNTTVVNSSIAQRTNGQIFLKRAMDICGGIVGSLITLILALFIWPIMHVKSPGPIFYKQERIGQNGRRFYMYKFRSMVLNADDLKKDLMAQNRIKDGMMFKVKDDPRIIPGIGEFIRKTSIDEFPQFFNVLIGDMSLVGTRPPTVDEWEKYQLEHRIRMAIKPGITGLWQVNGRSKITDFNKVIEYDTKYINNWSLTLDIEILIKTVFVLLSKREDEAMYSYCV